MASVIPRLLESGC